VFVVPNRIEILGVFGSGKSTLASKFASEDIEELAERHQDNPYWGDRATNERIGFLGYDLTFLLQHAQLSLKLRSKGLAVADWSFRSDRLWASMRLATDFPLYESIYDSIMSRIPPPIGYLYLKQSAETIIGRVLRRAREPELASLHTVSAAASRLHELVNTIDPAMVAIIDDDFDTERLLWYAKRWTEVNADD
jgi:deoxyadenosine/deoxycytidine kinase